jgi:hypothetical protein
MFIARVALNESSLLIGAKWELHLFDELKNIFIFERDFILLQPCQIFVFE